tara:strand:- start:20103 stop:21257 length:1155 start_codon:yes stop_codon:yes gene_type:complete
MKKKLLLLNGSHSELTLIQKAMELGLEVITTGNAPDLIGHKLADRYIAADYTDRSAILKIAKQESIDFICSCANDGGAITASYVAHELGLPGHDDPEVCELIHLKDKFKKWALDQGLPTSPLFSPEESANHLPVIVKPTDLTGGKGISVVRSSSELKYAIELAKKASPSNSYIVEKFVEGTLHSFSTIVSRQTVVATHSDNEFSTINPFTVSASYSPAPHLKPIKSSLVELTESIAKNLKLEDGIVHYQYLWDGKQYWIIEITRRCSGDLYPAPASLAIQRSWEEAILLACMGQPLDFLSGAEQEGNFGRVCFMAHKNGEIKDFKIHPLLEKNVVETVFARPVGYSISNFKIEKLGVAILKFRDKQEAEEKAKFIDEWTQVVVD